MMNHPNCPSARLRPKLRTVIQILSVIPKSICTMPMTSAMEKNCPWKSKNFTEGNHVFILIPKNEPQNRPKATVDKPHIVANHAARRIMPGLRNLYSMKAPIRARMAP